MFWACSDPRVLFLALCLVNVLNKIDFSALVFFEGRRNTAITLAKIPKTFFLFFYLQARLFPTPLFFLKKKKQKQPSAWEEIFLDVQFPGLVSHLLFSKKPPNPV